MVQAGVTASNIAASNPGLQQCGGGTCPNPGTGTATSACNPYNWYYYASNYGVKITSAESDSSEYHPGDVVTITGTVQLLRQDYYVNECGYVGAVDPVEANAGLVKLAVAGLFGGAITNNGGSFTAKVNVPPEAESGAVTYTITASYSSAHDSSEVSFQIVAYTPAVSVEMTHGSFVYPGETCTVSGSGWMPNGMVTLDYGYLGMQSTVAVDGSGGFTAPPVTVPKDSDEETYTVTATEAPNLQAETSVVIKWHQLIITLDVSPASVQQGDVATISGTVTDSEGKMVPDATVTFDTQGLADLSSTSTDASGQFTTGLTVGADASAKSYQITATAEKAGGYHSADAGRGLQVTERPPLPNLTGIAIALAGAAGGAGVAVATGGRRQDGGGDDAGEENQEPPALEKPPPCQSELQKLREASQQAKAIAAVLQFLRNQYNAMDKAYEDARQTGFWTGFNWTAKLSLMGALGFEQEVAPFLKAEGAIQKGLEKGGEAFVKNYLESKYPAFLKKLADTLGPKRAEWVIEKLGEQAAWPFAKTAEKRIDEGLQKISGLPEAAGESWTEWAYGFIPGYDTYKTWVKEVPEQMEKMAQARESLSKIQELISQAQSDYETALQNMQVARDVYNDCMGLKKGYQTLQAAEDPTTPSS